MKRERFVYAVRNAIDYSTVMRGWRAVKEEEIVYHIEERETETHVRIVW